MRPQFPGYGISTEPEGMLPWSWLSERMAAAQNYWIVTAHPDGRPHAMPVWGAWLDETFYFSTGRGSAKARNLAHRPELVVHLESGDEVVILEGSAEEADRSLHRRLAEALGAKYPYEPDPDDMGSCSRFARGEPTPGANATTRSRQRASPCHSVSRATRPG